MKQYIDNAVFLKSLKEYKRDVNKAKRSKEDKPRVPEYVGECLLKIANHLSFKPNFIGYTFREDMVSEGVRTCLQYIDNFNPKISKNPFSYFTQIIYFSFLQKIQTEKKQTYIKNEIIQNMPFDTFDTQQYNSVGETVNAYFTDLRKNNNAEYSASIEKVIAKRKQKREEKKAQKNKLEIFMQ